MGGWVFPGKFLRCKGCENRTFYWTIPNVLSPPVQRVCRVGSYASLSVCSLDLTRKGKPETLPQHTMSIWQYVNTTLNKSFQELSQVLSEWQVGPIATQIAFLVQPRAELLISQDQTWKLLCLDSPQYFCMIVYLGFSGSPSLNTQPMT